MDFRFARALLTMSLRASVALRGAFLLQVGLMALNNLFFFTTWWLLFQRFDQIRGWRMPDMLALYGVSATGFGLAAVTCGGMFELARAISEGELDTLLNQPRSVLLRAIASRSRASGWGDVLSGLGLLALSGYWQLQTTPAVLLAVVLCAVAFASCSVVLHSTAFWLGHVEGLARQLFEFVIAFSLYPPSLFGTGMRVVLFTLLPAGLVTYLPVELVRDFHWSGALLATSVVLSYALLAGKLFERGLRRYESGSRFG
jgi:ABC-2 type transport system permease protein